MLMIIRTQIQINMNRPTQTNIRKIFGSKGIQLGAGALDMIERELVQLTKKMAKRCQEGNLKRLTPELFWVAMGRGIDSTRWYRE